MTDQATERMVVDASPARCFAVAIDFEHYPDWVAAVKTVRVDERDGEGRGTRVTFGAGAFGRHISYTLVYDYSAAPGKLSWSQGAGSLTARIDGSYAFEPLGEKTDVTYHLAVDLRLPVPTFVKRRAEGLIMHAALRELKARAESQAA